MVPAGGEWQPGGDELTPTMKLKRRPIAQKYAAEIEALYAGSPAPALFLALIRALVGVVGSPQPLPGRGGSGSNQIGLDTTSITKPR